MCNGIKIKLFSIFLVLLCWNVPPNVFAHNLTEGVQAPLFTHLGSLSFPVSTKVPLAQKFFTQGMILYYGFEWGESMRSFKEATRLDPNCGMCYWGLALATGSKINAPISGHEYQDAKNAISKALALKNYETASEQAYVEALALRFQHKPIQSKPKSGVFSCHIASTSTDLSSKQELLNYAHAMQNLSARFPKDNNASALYAYAVFNTIDWKFWDENGKINSQTSSLIQVLKSILEKDKFHIGGNHYYIHVIEQSPNPEQALASAKRLNALVPGSEHLVHMPAHIYFLTGRYHDASRANQHGISVFNDYNKTCKEQGFMPEINYLWFHNYDYLRTSAAMEGRKHIALSAAQEMLAPPFSTWLANDATLQWFIPIPYFVEARFGMWSDILKEPKPSEQYQYALGMWHYVQGMAYMHNRNSNRAVVEERLLKQIIAKGPAQSNLQENGLNLLKIADLILLAMIADARGDEQLTISSLKQAQKIQHDMGYHEPPDWYFPMTEVLGDAYLKWNHPGQAIELYKQNLKQYPKNGWTLIRLAQSLKLLGKNEVADRVMLDFKESWKYADVPAPISLFSKLNSSE